MNEIKSEEIYCQCEQNEEAEIIGREGETREG
jgi:hypothetical protein